MPSPQLEPTKTASAPGTHRGLAITAMVVGIFAFLTSGIPFLGGLLGVIALVMGTIAVKKAEGGMAVAGIVLGVLAILINIAVGLFFLFIFGAVADGIENSTCTIDSDDLDCAAGLQISDINILLLTNSAGVPITDISATAGDGCEVQSLDGTTLLPDDAVGLALECTDLESSQITFEISYTIGGESRRVSGQA